MVTQNKYNGWTNYETWLVALWIDNDEGSYNTARDMAREMRNNEHRNYDLSHALKDWVEELNPLADNADLFSDLLNAALSEVDWYEIAEHYFWDMSSEYIAPIIEVD